jgi:hypothetical protein
VVFDKAGSGLLNDQVNEISLSADGSVWLAHEPFFEEPGETSGASRLVWQPGDSSSSIWSTWTPEGGLPSGFAFAAAPSGGAAWIGTKSGLALVGPGSGEIQMVLTTSDGLPSNDVEALLMTRSGVLYAGTTGGLATVAPGGASASPVTGMDDAIGALCADNLGGIWAAGSAALYRIAPDGSIESYNRYNSPLLSTAINGMDCDFDAGTVYLATDHGCWAMHLGQGMAGDGSGATVFPNPFLPGDGQVLGVAGIQDLPTSIRVFDLSGRLVYESAFPGRDEIAWDGGDSGGSPASAGIYMVEVVQQDMAVRLKLALVR